MRFKAPPCVVVVKREDKQEKLTQFLNSFLDRRGRDGPLEALASLSLVARSADSPVAHALAGLGERLIGNGLAVRAIFATLGPQEVAASWCPGGALPFDRDVRMMHNPRLLEAHELLILDPRTCWIGDSMRRDPAKRDAWEYFVEASTESAAFARTSFERLWALAEPVARAARAPRSTLVAPVVTADPADGLAPPAPQGDSEPSAATRH
jgi:hypothetical protein